MPSKSLSALVPPAWRTLLKPELTAPSFQTLETFVDGEFAGATPIFPPRDQIFAALSDTPPDAVKAVIFGQDPYPTAGNANGLAFSVSPGKRVPPSLVNIYKGLNADLGTPISKSGDLTPWAKAGVLLLNTVLTVREGEPNSHKKKGWEAFTEGVLKHVNRSEGPVVFFCFGAPAKKIAEGLVDGSKHTIFAVPHPSPMNKDAFVTAVAKEKIFSKANQLLVKAGRGPIDWTLP